MYTSNVFYHSLIYHKNVNVVQMVFVNITAWICGCYTNTEEQRSREDGGCRSCAGHQHGQHGPSKHQLLRHWCHHLVPEPHCISRTQPPRLNICEDKVYMMTYTSNKCRHTCKTHQPQFSFWPNKTQSVTHREQTAALQWSLEGCLLPNESWDQDKIPDV